MSDLRRVLITGIGGSGGSYLAEYIVHNHPGVEVHGFARWHGAAQDNLQAVAGKVRMHEVDLNDFGSVLSGLQEAAPHDGHPMARSLVDGQAGSMAEYTAVTLGDQRSRRQPRRATAPTPPPPAAAP